MDQRSLLPPRASTQFLRAFEQATAYEPRVVSGVDAIRNVKGRQLPGWLQFLLYEYGLIELTPYVPNPYTLLAQGRTWQIERDTFAAVARGLGWVSAPATIVEAPERRAWWNSFQLYFESLPPADFPNLERIEKIVGLSSPYRSDFRRGVFGYDAPALEGDVTRLDASLLDFESGVRLRPGGPLWSFGRVHELSHTLTEAEGTALDNWLPGVAEDAFFVDLVAMTAIIEEETVPIEDAIDFERSTPKWHDSTAGVWTEFGIDEIATTDRGALIEDAADRLCLFIPPEFNPLDDDPAAATVDQIAIADPFGGNQAIRVTFTADAGRTFLIPASGLLPGTTYSFSFFARLISSSGVTTGGGDAGFQDVFNQLVVGQWVRVKGAPFTTGEIAGQWVDLTLSNPGAVLTVELFGFQLEAGPKVTSPIDGTEITGHRAADILTLNIPPGLNNVVVRFDNNSGQSFIGVIGPFTIVPSELLRPLLLEVGNASASTWESMAFPWAEANFPWVSDAVTQRQIALAGWFEGKNAYVALRDGAGDLIGYRRARVVRQVDPEIGGPYLFGAARYKSTIAGRSAFVEAMTDAGNGSGVVAKTAEFVFEATLAPGIPPGALWLAPDELVGGVPIAASPIDIPLRATVRERIKLMLRF